MWKTMTVKRVKRGFKIELYVMGFPKETWYRKHEKAAVHFTENSGLVRAEVPEYKQKQGIIAAYISL